MLHKHSYVLLCYICLSYKRGNDDDDDAVDDDDDDDDDDVDDLMI